MTQQPRFTQERDKWARGAIQFIDPLDVPPVLSLLREYIYYYKIDYEKSCLSKDKLFNGTLKQEQFRSILNKYVYPFTKQELDSLLAISPKNYQNEIQYKAFFNGIKRLGKPRTQLSLQKMLKNS